MKKTMEEWIKELGIVDEGDIVSEEDLEGEYAEIPDEEEESSDD